MKNILSVIIAVLFCLDGGYGQPNGSFNFTFGTFANAETKQYMEKLANASLTALYAYSGKPFTTRTIEISQVPNPPFSIPNSEPRVVKRENNKLILLRRLQDPILDSVVNTEFILGLYEIFYSDIESESDWFLRGASAFQAQTVNIKTGGSVFSREHALGGNFHNEQVDYAGGLQNANGRKSWQGYLSHLNLPEEELFASQAVVAQIASAVISSGDLWNTDFFKKFNEKLNSQFKAGKTKFSVQELLALFAPVETVIDNLPLADWLSKKNIAFDNGADGIFSSVWAVRVEQSSTRLIQRINGKQTHIPVVSNQNANSFTHFDIETINRELELRDNTTFKGTIGSYTAGILSETDTFKQTPGVHRLKNVFFYNDTPFVSTTFFPRIIKKDPDGSERVNGFLTFAKGGVVELGRDSGKGVMVVVVDPKKKITSADTDGEILGSWNGAYNIMPPNVEKLPSKLRIFDRYYNIPLPFSRAIYLFESDFYLPLSEKSLAGLQGIAIANPSDRIVEAKLGFYEDSGSMIEDAKVIIHPRSYHMTDAENIGQIARLTAELFPTARNDSSYIKITGDPELKIFTLRLDNGFTYVDGNNALFLPSKRQILPEVASKMEIALLNPMRTPANVTVFAKNKTGQVTSQKTLTVLPGHQARLTASDFTALDPVGYIEIQSDIEIFALEETYPASDNLVISGLDTAKAVNQTTVFAWLGQKKGLVETRYKLINVGTQSSTFRLTLRNLPSNASAQRTSVDFTIGPGEKITVNPEETFGLSGELATGFVVVENPKELVGALTFVYDSGAAASLPLQTRPEIDYIYGHVAEGPAGNPVDFRWLTGITMVNENDAPVKVIIQVFKSEKLQNGNSKLVETGKFIGTIPAHTNLTKLIQELVPAAKGQAGGFIQVTADKPIFSFCLFLTESLKIMSALEGQTR